jgi:hypothetical protein
MIALKGHRLGIVVGAADKPRYFCRRAAGRLRLRGFRFTDADLDDAVRLALQRLSQDLMQPRRFTPPCRVNLTNSPPF